MLGSVFPLPNGAILDGMERTPFRLVVYAALAAPLVLVTLAGTCAQAAPRYFGFSWVHNPSAATVPYSFTNIDVRPVYVSDPVTKASDDARSIYDSYGVSSVLGFNDFLYGENNTGAVPRPDAIDLFDAWWDGSVNRSTVRPPWVIAVWPADSALLRCDGAPDVAACLQPYLAFVGHVRDRVAGAGVLLVDSFDSATVADGLLTRQAIELANAGIRWFGYHQYGVMHPLADATYQANVRRVRQLAAELRTAGYPAQFVLVGDAFHDRFHTKLAGGVLVLWDWADHRAVVGEDFRVACLSDAVALILFNWPDYSWLAEQNVTGSASFQNPAACWEACLGRFVKFHETTCDICGDGPAALNCLGPGLVRRHLRRR